MMDSTTAQRLIHEAMPVVCSEDGQFAVVDHLEGGELIKLTKDATGQHHYIPLTWVTSVDDKVHVDRTADQVMQEWSTTPDELADAAPAPAVEPPARAINSVDATVGQPLVDRVLARKYELEAALARLPEADRRGRDDVALALTTIDQLLTGDLKQIPAVVAADMNLWLERHKHLAERADAPAIEAPPSSAANEAVTATFDVPSAATPRA